MKKIVIIGNGIAGITAANTIRKLSPLSKVVVISSESKHFFSRTALMYVYMGHMKFEHTQPYDKEFWWRSQFELMKDEVLEIDTDKMKIELKSKTEMAYDSLILATGSNYKRLDIEGSDAIGVQGLYHLDDLKLMEENTAKAQLAVVIGGGLIGIEMAEMLHSRGIGVTFLVREGWFYGRVLPEEEGRMINTHLESKGIRVKYNTNATKILKNAEGKVEAVVTDDSENFYCDFVGITIGVEPNISVQHRNTIATNKGFLVDEYLRTNAYEVYAIGDCAELKKPTTGRKSTEAVWYTARMMGEIVAQNVFGKEKKYNPGVWFNSAKFFDIEYQTYGYVPSKEMRGINSVFWKNQAQTKSFRMVYQTNTRELLGVITLGIRIKHEVFDQWISKKMLLEDCIEALESALFESEFSENLLPTLVEEFQPKANRKLSLKLISRRLSFFKK